MSHRIGPYEIIREVGSSNDVVYEARDSRSGVMVALKVLEANVGRAKIEWFEREGRITSSLDHPNIVRSHESGQAEGTRFLAMELLRGQTLKQVSERGPLSPQGAVTHLMGLLPALHYLHRKGIVHRDVKPDNVFLLGDGTIKLTDFGFVKVLHEKDIVEATGTVGTPEYMSPEQTAGADIDPRSDLFSVGLVLHELLTGKQVFRGDTIQAVAYAVTYKAAPRPQEIDDGLWTILQRALRKKPEERFGSAEEMLRSLVGWSTLPS